MYLGTKSYLKSNHYHTAKHSLKQGLTAEVHDVRLERSARQNRKSMTACCWNTSRETIL
jgi:hypothetical protein